jgi:hypothetical protein
MPGFREPLDQAVVGVGAARVSGEQHDRWRLRIAGLPVENVDSRDGAETVVHGVVLVWLLDEEALSASWTNGKSEYLTLQDTV